MCDPAQRLMLRSNEAQIENHSHRKGILVVETASGLRFEGSAFWVRHRHREFGPFDYEWSRDMLGIEFLYQRKKFGEYCSDDEISADLKEFRLPMRVVEVTAVVCGSIIFGIIHGFSQTEKKAILLKNLRQSQLTQYAENIEGLQES
jgi:hypothetical protein